MATTYNQIRKRLRDEKNAQRQAQRVLAELVKDENYRAMDEEMFQNHSDFIREQVQTILWS